MSVTTTERPDVKQLPPLDVAGVMSDAHEWVMNRLADCADDNARAVEAGRIVDTELENLEQVRPVRDAAAYTLVTDYRIRRGANVPGALGVQRSRWQVIRERQAAQVAAGTWIGPIPDAPEVLHDLAVYTLTHQARHGFALDERNTAVEKLLEKGLSNADIARLIGRDPSRVSVIKHKENAA